MCGNCDGGERGTPGSGALAFDESGELQQPQTDVVLRPCPIDALNGSWLLRVLGPLLSETRGPMRIEVGPSSLRVSGDIYSRRLRFPIVPQPVPPAEPWYPQLPQSQYSWYFRSAGATYADGVLEVRVVRHLWNRTTQDFTSTDTGSLRLTCSRPLLTLPGVPPIMAGQLTIGGNTHAVVAARTSPLYRGCRIEVDVMTGRKWPGGATLCNGTAVSFADVYRSAGFDAQVIVDELDLPEDAELTVAELQALLAGHRGSATGPNEWRQWLLLGSSQGTLFGLMFDDDAIPREGAVGFADATLSNDPEIQPSAQGQDLDDVPLAFLRTLTHEAGHSFNLFHPKADVHNPPIGTSVMNQTGDVIGFASVANPYPCNATMGFDEHSRRSLIHSPDPQVKPGWKAFSWGHGSLSGGLPEPADIAGFAVDDTAADLALGLTLPATVHPGEYVVAEFAVTNTGPTPREVSARLNLAEGDLRLVRRRPSGLLDQVSDVLLGCGPRPMVELAPGESITGRAQLLYTNAGFTFDEPGTHEITAEFDIGDGWTTARSDTVRIQVRPAQSAAERSAADLALEPRVGLAIALGDFGLDRAVGERLASFATEHADSDTGAAAALVMANSLSRTITDHRAALTDATRVREAEQDEAARFLALAAAGRSATRLLELATTVASPVERDAPVVAAALDVARGARKPKADLQRAAAVAEDFRDVKPR
jgi:hypothetical protein